MSKYSELENAHQRLKKIHDSTNEAVIALEDENKQLFNANVILETRNKELLKQIEVRVRVSNQALETANKQNNEYLETINSLRVKLNGIID